MTGGGKELNSSEAWYDAEEDLGPASATAKAKTQTAEADDGGAVQGQDTYLTSLLCVTQFPSDVTEVITFAQHFTSAAPELR